MIIIIIIYYIGLYNMGGSAGALGILYQALEEDAAVQALIGHHRKGTCKRGLGYGPQAPIFYGNLQDHAASNGFPRVPTGILFCSYRNLQTTSVVYGIM